MEAKYKLMTEQLRLTNSDEEVANYLRWIITGDTAKDYWKKELSKHPTDQLIKIVAEKHAIDSVTGDYDNNAFHDFCDGATWAMMKAFKQD